MSGEKWGYMQQYTSGLHFDPENPTPDMIDIEDIALGLSRESRYAGQTSEFYSVAQHSVLCSLIVVPHFKLWALLHDAAEAYVKDLPFPVKRLCPEYRELENRVMAVICEKFYLDDLEPSAVKEADLIMLATERRDLLGVKVVDGDYAPLGWSVVPVSSDEARHSFLREFNDLTGG